RYRTAAPPYPASQRDGPSHHNASARKSRRVAKLIPRNRHIHIGTLLPPGGRGYESSPRFISVFSRPTICCCPAAAASSLSHIPVNPRRISASPSSTCDRRSVGYSRIALSTRVFCSRNPRISALISVTSRSAASQHSGGCRVLLAAAHSL